MNMNFECENLVELSSLESELERLRRDERAIERVITEFHDMRRGGMSNDRLSRKIKSTEDELDSLKKEISKILIKINQLKNREG